MHNINCPKRADVIQNRNDACAETSLIIRVFCVRLDDRTVTSVEVLSFKFASVWLNMPRDHARLFDLIKNLWNERKCVSITNLSCPVNGDQ
jgi:hypothetical protein